MALPPLYFILNVPSDGEVAAAQALLRAHLHAGTRLVQIRAKRMHGSTLLRLVRRAVAACHRKNACLIVNDRLDVALLAGADGVHVGALDLPLAAVRRVARRLLVGATARSVRGAMRARASGADYVALGPMEVSTTKRVPARRRSVRVLRAAARALSQGPHPVPLVAVGGILPERAEALYRAGADCLAVSAALSRPSTLRRELRAFERAWQRARVRRA